MTEKREDRDACGRPERLLDWEKNLAERSQIEKFLETAERYWYGESFGSERRKTPS